MMGMNEWLVRSLAFVDVNVDAFCVRFYSKNPFRVESTAVFVEGGFGGLLACAGDGECSCGVLS